MAQRSPADDARPTTLGREPVRDVGGGTRPAPVRDLDGNVLGLLQEG